MPAIMGGAWFSFIEVQPPYNMIARQTRVILFHAKKTMKKFFLDCEFNGFGGELISIALVSENPLDDTFYAVIEWSNRPIPWVKKNVLPYLDLDPQPKETVARALAAYLRRSTVHIPTIIADWPEDLSHFAKIFTLDDGMMVPVMEFDLQFRRIHKDVVSARPHNALSDAIALRDNYKNNSA